MRNALRIAGGAAALLTAGYGAYVLNEKRIEQPDYRVIRADGNFEVREYPSVLTATVRVTGDRDSALQSGFRQLADYIFAKSRGGESIAMTAPVMQQRETIAMTAPVIQQAGEAGTWAVRFVMPSEYTRETLPPPPDGVTIEEEPARRVAALKFGGRAGSTSLARQTRRLEEWMASEGLSAEGEAEYAYYNSPFVLPFLRRNEVVLPLGAAAP